MFEFFLISGRLIDIAPFIIVRKQKGILESMGPLRNYLPLTFFII